MSKRNLKKLSGPYSSNLIGKLWAKINTSAYGTVALPSATQALTHKGDTSIQMEYEDEKSGARTNARSEFAPIRMKGKNKVQISTHLHVSGDSAVESSLSAFMELIMGKKEVVAATRGASASIQDSLGQIAGILLTTAGSLLGVAGNYTQLKLVNGGATGSASLTFAGNVFTLTYFNDTTVEDAILALDAHADLTASVDTFGDDTTDLLVDLLAQANLQSNSVVLFSGGSEKGFLYSNVQAPIHDMTIVYNKEKTGEVITGVILDKLSIDVGDKLPTVKIEGVARKSMKQGIAQVVSASSAITKLYVGADYNRFVVDKSVDSFIDILAVDGITYKYKALKVVSTGVDVTGSYVQVDTPVTTTLNDYVAFHEPETHNPEFNPLNGMTGSAKVDQIEFDEVRSIKFEYANNHQIFDNLALEDSIKGFDPAKNIACKMSFEVLARDTHTALINKLRGANVIEVPIEVTVGSEAGSKLVIFIRQAYVKAPNLNDKSDEVQSFTIEAEAIISPDSVDLDSVSLIMC